MDKRDLANLVEQAKKGDEAAIRDLLRRFESDVRIVVRARLPRALRSQFDTMDFVQAVWASVLTNDGPDLARFDNSRRLRGYLAKVATNKVFQEHRRRTQTQKFDLRRQEPLFIRSSGREVLRPLVSPGPTPSQDAQAGDRLAQITEGCSNSVRKIIELRRQGMTYAEIAEEAGVHVDAVRRKVEPIRLRMEERKWQ
jgi:RNA polymerase sigma-70 factor (ECF subfamily)